MTGLKPGRDYHYRLKAGAAVSPMGRTRTLPTGALDQAGARLRQLRPLSRAAISTPTTTSPKQRARSTPSSASGRLHLRVRRRADRLRHGHGRPLRPHPRAAARDRSPWPTTARATPSTAATSTCRPPMPARRGSCVWDDHDDRQRQLERRGRRTTSRRPKATGSSAKRRRCRPITSGCRSASRSPAGRRRPSIAASTSATWPA